MQERVKANKEDADHMSATAVNYGAVHGAVAMI